MAKACFSSLLHTAIKASFLLFPLAIIRSYISLQALLCLQAEKLHINRRFRSFALPILVIRLRLDILVMLTPHSGHTDPPKDLGQKDNLMTILQFFSKTFSFEFYSVRGVYQAI